MPIRAAGFVVLDRLGRVLVLLGNDLKWDLPKGRLNVGEDDLAGAIREVWEETGVDPIYPGSGRPKSVVVTTSSGHKHRYFLGRSPSPNVRLSVEHQTFLWVPPMAAVELLPAHLARAVRLLVS